MGSGSSEVVNTMEFWDPIEALFLSTDISGWFGPFALIVISFAILTNKKMKPLGVLFMVLETLVIWYYLDLVEATPWYWWNIIILIVGELLCLAQMAR